MKTVVSLAVWQVLLICGTFHVLPQYRVLAMNNVIPTDYSNMTCHLASGKEGICVYAYLCQNDVINTDGTAIIDLRYSDDCEDYFLKCCSKESSCLENTGTCLPRTQCKADLNASKYKEYKETDECDWSGYQCCPNDIPKQDNSTVNGGKKDVNIETECGDNSICVPDGQCLVNPDGVNLVEARNSVCSGSSTCCPRGKVNKTVSNSCEMIGGTCVQQGQCKNPYIVDERTERCTEPGFECCMAVTEPTSSSEGKPCLNNNGICSKECTGTKYTDRKNECNGLTCCSLPPASPTPPTTVDEQPCSNGNGVCSPRIDCKGAVYEDRNTECGGLVCCARLGEISTSGENTDPTPVVKPDSSTCEAMGGTCEPGYRCLTETDQSAVDCGYNVCCLAKKSEPDMVVKDCGYRNERGVKFDTINRHNGETQYGEFPWMVAIMVNQTGKIALSCGGTLIEPEVVMTTAACAKLFKRTPDKLIIRAGEWDIGANMEPIPFQERRVRKIINHPEFKPTTLVNNIALLFLDDKFDLSATINTACLPPQDFFINNGELIATGWGTTPQNRTKHQQILKYIDLIYTPKSDCEQILRKVTYRTFKLHSSFLCAGGEAGLDTCQGDAGSPVVFPIQDDAEDRYYAVGMVSWGIGCGRAGIPAVYTDVGKFRTWIDEEMERENLQMHYYDYQPQSSNSDDEI